MSSIFFLYFSTWLLLNLIFLLLINMSVCFALCKWAGGVGGGIILYSHSLFYRLLWGQMWTWNDTPALFLPSLKGNLCCGPPSSSGPYIKERAARSGSRTTRRSSWRRSLRHRNTSHLRRGNDWLRCCSSARGRWADSCFIGTNSLFKVHSGKTLCGFSIPHI